MNTKDFLQAMNEIDHKYIEQADIFAPAVPVKVPVISHVLHWAGGAAACVLVAAGLWLMWDLGLLADINEVPASQKAEDEQSIQPGKSIPLSELPTLEFPTREEVGERGGEIIGCGPALTEKDLTEEQVAAIWGQQGYLSWEGLYLSGPSAEYDSNGTAYYNEDGKLSYVSLTVKKNADLGSGCSFTVEITPGYINFLGFHMAGPPSRICDMWGTEVTTLAAYGDSPSAAFSISFLTGPEGEEGTLGVTAKGVISDEPNTTRIQEDAKELLTRLASQCLRPGNVFQLSHLEQEIPSVMEESEPDGAESNLESTANETDQQDGEEIDFESAAKEIAQQYADSWLSMSEPGYPPLAECFYTDLDWAESAEPDNDIQVSCRMVFRLEDPEGGLGSWIAGSTKPGTGEYEGYYTAFRFIYAKQENGRWVITGSGTGP